MMNKSFVFLIAMMTLLLPTFSQPISSKSFTRLESVGEFPAPLNAILNKDKEKDKAIAAADSEIRYLLREGFILYGDSVTAYLESILDYLLESEPELRKQIHIYTLKSSVVNATMYSNGIMLLNMGLIAQSTNEAELAFVISHELIHYIKKHALRKNEKINNIESFLQYHSRSREMEVEADRLGYELFFNKAGYNSDAVNGVFDILQYSHLPFDEIPMQRSLFEKDFYRMDDKYFLETVKPITFSEKEIDTFSTHPNMHTRRLEMENLLQSKRTGELFVLGEDKYKLIRTLARYETINQQLVEKEFLMSYYNTFVMKQGVSGNTFFLDIAETASLYGMYKMKMKNVYAEYVPKAKTMEGEMQFAANFFENINKREFALFCLRSIWEVKKKYQENVYLSLLFDDIVSDMANEYNMKTLADFSDYGINEEIDSPVEGEETNEDNINKSKYDKIKQGKKTGHQKNFKTENYMLVDLKKDSDFVSSFENSLSKNEQELANRFIKSYSKSKKKELKGEKEFLVFRPTAYEYKTQGRTRSIKYNKTETHTRRLEKRLRQMAKRNDINTKIVSNNLTNFTSEQIKDYQTYSRINDFYRSMNSFSEITYESRDVSELLDKIDVRYLNIVAYEQSALNKIANPWCKFLYGEIGRASCRERV